MGRKPGLRPSRENGCAKTDRGAAMKRVDPSSPLNESSVHKGCRNLFGDPKSEEEEEGGLYPNTEGSLAVSMSGKSFIKLLSHKASEVTFSVLSITVYPRRYYPPDEELLVSSTTVAYPVAPMSVNCSERTAFVDDIEGVNTTPNSSQGFLKFPEETRKPWWASPVWGYPGVQPENTTTQSQVEDLFWGWISLKKFTVQELKELREDRLLSYVLGQRNLRIEFAHLIAKRQPHHVMEGFKQQPKSGS
ncbi:Hypothetical protein PHPALM_17818 [Phytophthora palmivora]|uniref:ATP-binding cassette (ABC) Superfamily n=1 Tax=Phytophthora palmivora TaxID=4796 RepID=A0A2P4XLC4_9STRA|nr:Hypothetical protein PHPALM_17818 [Phytophthora palmivora]